MIVAVVVALLLMLGWALVRRVRAQRLFRAVRAMAQPANPNRARLQRLATETAKAVEVDRLAALQVERNTRALIPLPSNTVDSQRPVKPITDLLDTLEKYSILTAGMEQVLLNVASMPDPVLQLTELWYAGMVPQHLQGAATHVLHYIGHQFGPDVLASAKDVVGDVLRQFAEPETVARLAEHTLQGLAEGGVMHAGEQMIQTMASSTFNAEMGLKAIEHLAHHAQHAPDLVTAGQHLESLAHGVGHAAGSMDFLGGAHGHIPVITMFVSAWREMRLLDEGKTTSERALENWTTDVASAGGGAIVGGVIGQVLIPIPGVGAVIGAAAGGILGRLFGNDLKARHYKEAVAAYEAAHAKMLSETQRAGKQAVAQVRAQGQVAQRAYLSQIGTAPRLDKVVSPQLVPVVAGLHGDVAASLARTRRVVDRAQRFVGAGAALRATCLFVPVPADLGASVKTVRARVDESQRLLPAPTAARADALGSLDKIARVAQRLPLVERDERTQMRRWEQSQRRVQALLLSYRKQVLTWERKAADVYKTVASTYIPLALAQAQAYSKEQQRLMKPVEAAAATVKVEHDRLGLH